MNRVFQYEVNGLPVQAAFDQRDIDGVWLPLLGKLSEMQRQKQRRICAFLAAPPAAGKSTLCRLLEDLSRKEPGLVPVQTVGIDGFHHTNEYLLSHFIERDGQLIPLRKIKGAPETYDVAALSALLDRLNQPNQRWPVYDRRIHDPVPSAVEIVESILIVEGNWLLLDEAPWNGLSCDYSVFLRAGDESQLERVVQRKIAGGFDEAAAREFVLQNDWPNILRCMQGSRRGDLNLQLGPEGLWEEI